MNNLNLLGDWFFFQNTLVKKEQFDTLISDKTNRLYEVIRIVNSTPLFIEDHYGRFLQSIAQMNLKIDIPLQELKSYIKLVITKNKLVNCNLRFEVILKENDPLLAVYTIPFNYPPEETYKTGVQLSTFQIERKNPQIKQSDVNDAVRQQIKDLFIKTSAFEVLLIDHQGNITEGSRSNVFFVKDNTLYSPPSAQMLEGITRKKVISIAKKLTIKFIIADIPFASINQFDACFITGTSPKILPICSINNLIFNPQNTLVQELMLEYNNLIIESISQN
jgi:branched-chain amino acid aminotransferase